MASALRVARHPQALPPKSPPFLKPLSISTVLAVCLGRPRATRVTTSAHGNARDLLNSMRKRRVRRRPQGDALAQLRHYRLQQPPLEIKDPGVEARSPQLPVLRKWEAVEPVEQRMWHWDVSTWHMRFKRLSNEAFFREAVERPEFLRIYTEQYKAEPHTKAEREVIPQVAGLLQELLAPDAQVADLGCGEALLAEELRGTGWPGEVVGVDALALSEGVVVRNLAALPEEWTGRFDGVVLCRALWGKNYNAVLQEARRVLRPEASSCLVVVEPLKRWWGREEPNCNSLLAALERRGLCLDRSWSRDFEPRQQEGIHPLKGFFQYLVTHPATEAP